LASFFFGEHTSLGVREKTSELRVRIMCPYEATYLPEDNTMNIQYSVVLVC